MVSILKSTMNSETGTDIQAIMNDISSLKDDIAALTGHLKNNAINATNGAAEQIGDQAARVYGNLSAQGQRSAKAISQQVEDQPLMSLIVVFALGFIGSRLLSHNSR